jgi:hypothetical protein
MKNAHHYFFNLIFNFLENKIEPEKFRISYENSWTFEVEKNDLPQEAFRALQELFDEVVLFSPFAKDTWEYPNYRTEADIRNIAQITLTRIGTDE